MVKVIRTTRSVELAEEIFSKRSDEMTTLPFVSAIAALDDSLIRTVPLETVKTVGSTAEIPVVRESVVEEVPIDGTCILLPFLMVEVINCII